MVQGALMGERSLLVVIVMAVLGVACGGAAAGTEAVTRHGVTPAMHSAADALRNYLVNNLQRMTDDAARAAHVAEARRQLAELKSKAKTDADRNVMLILALLMAKDNERAGRVSLSRAGGAYPRPEIAELYEAREACYAELMGWLDYRKFETAALTSGKCVGEAKAAAAVLGL